ncbi:MAG: response regulator transcription factor [Deltaproteobacteria bacterium]|jgi:DNA-binding NarL/FixJ family response regulator|nr:response regulator transcription factor [Deltaproteobacteria bacterium]MCL5879783.1 response regulator transcription factor [Deltaproteobacteria bacterium]MDA8303934.1 response regulator transcription factor [Deltaproteobacteria bacterium]
MITIVLVDDHSILLTTLKIFLDSQEGISVAGTANDALRAVELIKTKNPDVVLLDISMPKISGIDLIPKIKKVSPNSKILILTMFEDKQYMQKVLDAGASGFLVKKAMDYDLVYAIRTVARGEIYIHPQLLEDFMANKNKASEDVLSREEALWNALSNREKEVMTGVAKGFTNKEIAEKHFLSEKTVATYRSRGMEKLGFENKSELIDLIFFKLKILKK